MHYQHTQRGNLVLGICGAFCLLTLLSSLMFSSPILVLPVVAPFLLFGWLFHSLTIEVDPRQIELRFGPGLIWKRFKTAEIQSARTVRNHWYQGWGIRWIWSGWLFNISGLDAVEIDLSSGRRYRLGTDQPQKLLRAIHSACGSPLGSTRQP
ncbi:MAG: hypothetical protein ACE5ID_08635 [Acidobacteriota bacterium]